MAKVVVNTAGLSYAEWLEYRKLGIGGSDASVVCGFSRLLIWQTIGFLHPQLDR